MMVETQATPISIASNAASRQANQTGRPVLPGMLELIELRLGG
ncbi:hypothetical protein [Staphylococcus aureus]